jgi:PPOX class probable F420-dependent enzyme
MTLTQDVKRLIDKANFAHLATLMADGSPQIAPVWVGREGERILIATGEGSLKAKNAQRDARIALSLVDFENPYEEIQIRGRVVERRPDGDLAVMDRISHKYTSAPFPRRDPAGRIVLVVEADRVRHQTLPFRHSPGGPR